MENIEVIFLIILTVVGWLVAYIFTLRAQNRNFINQLLNNARVDILDRTRDYQNWLSEVYNLVNGVDYSFIIHELGLPVEWMDKFKSMSELFFSDKRSLEWNFCIERYEILFPETNECRVQLSERHQNIQEYLNSFLQEFPLGNFNENEYISKKQKLKELKKNPNTLIDQLSLIMDLHIYLQNKCLSRFTGYRIPERKPQDPTAPKIIKSKDGMLKIVESGG